MSPNTCTMYVVLVILETIFYSLTAFTEQSTKLLMRR